MGTSNVKTISKTKEDCEVEDIMRRLQLAKQTPSKTNLENYFKGEGNNKDTKDRKGGGEGKKKRITRR